MSELRIARYRLRRDLTLAEAKGRVTPGDILVNGRVLVLHCPACAALQFTPRAVGGPDSAPDILEPVQCGAGFCRRCGVWFRVEHGAPVLVPAPAGQPARVPSRLEAAGVFPPRPLKDA